MQPTSSTQPTKFDHGGCGAYVDQSAIIVVFLPVAAVVVWR
ncbi:MAG: hypothetical protein ACRDT4_16920 [Micromonosporaceae bacterium]